MNTIRPGLLLTVCAAFSAVAVPGVLALWLRANNSFIGGVTMIGSSNGQPREIATGWLFVIAGLLAALAYSVPAAIALLALRRFSIPVRNAAILIILPVALWFAWSRLTGRG